MSNNEPAFVDRSSGSTEALATARWAEWPELSKLVYKPGDIWLGYSADDVDMPLGYNDDRHICLTAGTRSGKGATFVINNLTLWPGSLVCVDPKGENATVTARRRGKGSAHCEGIGQAVYILDPFGVVKHDDDDFKDIKARFNPLDAIDPDSEEAIDEAGRLADAIVVPTPNSQDPFWEDSARAFIRGLIMHVLTDEDFEGKRNLVTVRQLITRGDWETVAILKEAGEQDIPSPFQLLFEGLRCNEAHDGVIAACGETFGSMSENSEKTFDSVLQVSNRNTEFIDSPGMKRVLAGSDFSLSDIKTSPKGVSIFLSLPQRFMNTHYRWLRMMVSLVTTEMEKVRGQPKTGHKILMCLDEFAGLKKMEVIENAAAQIAGYGVKLLFIIQNLGQLKETYKDNWQTFLGNAGLKIYFEVDNEFTQNYLSKQLGETEIIRQTMSKGSSQGRSSGQGMNLASLASPQGALGALIPNPNTGQHQGVSTNASEGIHKTALLAPDEIRKTFSRIDEEDIPGYPGLALIFVPGMNPVIIRKANYYNDDSFKGRFDPHTDFDAPALLDEDDLPSARDKEAAITGALYEQYGLLNVGKAELLYEALQDEQPDHPILEHGEAEFVAEVFRYIKRKNNTNEPIENHIDREIAFLLEFLLEHELSGLGDTESATTNYTKTAPKKLPIIVEERSQNTKTTSGSYPKSSKKKHVFLAAAGCLVFIGLVIAGNVNKSAPPTPRKQIIADNTNKTTPPPLSKKPAYDLFDYPWRSLKNQALKRNLAKLSPINKINKISTKTTQFLISTLPWYNNISIVRAKDPSWSKKNLFLYFMVEGDKVKSWLNGTSTPVHKIHKTIKPRLNKNNAIAYAYFFTFFIRGKEGPFLIVQNTGDTFVPKAVSTKIKNKIKRAIRPSKVTSSNSDGSFNITSIIMYSNALFEAKFKLEPSGMLTMVNDTPIVADLPVKIDAPIN